MNDWNSDLKAIRVSVGSAVLLGLIQGKLVAKPTTIYLLTYRKGRCIANCGFCPQARESEGRTDMLSRVTWPVFTLQEVIEGIKRKIDEDKIERVCIQALNYPSVFWDIVKIVESVNKNVNVPISVSCQPLSLREMMYLREVGAERVSIALDAATESIFRTVKGEEANGPYTWKNHLNTLMQATKIFGKKRVTTHLIIGLGESEEEAVKTIQYCHDIGVYPALFAFTPIPGTRLEKKPRPPISVYRRVQVAQYLITRDITRYERMIFEEGRIYSFGVPSETLLRIIENGEPFCTTGCPGCNRPYYNERPRGPIYNYPQKPDYEEIIKIKEEIRLQEVSLPRL